MHQYDVFTPAFRNLDGVVSGRFCRTWSLLTMLAVPRKGDCSKVSMELSRCKQWLASLSLVPLFEWSADQRT